MSLDPDPSPVSDRHFRLAGFALAHALGSIDGGGTLCTLAVVALEGERALVRFEAQSIPESIVLANRDLPARIGSTGMAALVSDGYVTIERVRHDALLVDLIMPGGITAATVIQAYRPGRFGPIGLLRAVGVPLPGGLAVIGRPISESPLPPEALAALTHGLAEHPYGRRAYRLSKNPDVSSDIAAP